MVLILLKNDRRNKLEILLLFENNHTILCGLNLYICWHTFRIELDILLLVLPAQKGEHLKIGESIQIVYGRSLQNYQKFGLSLYSSVDFYVGLPTKFPRFNGDNAERDNEEQNGHV